MNLTIDVKKMFRKYCNKCSYLDIDEDLQDFFLKATKKYRPHMCLYYKKRVRHMNQQPNIVRLSYCDQYKIEDIYT